ncbi:hypothetical protein EVG20_g9708, partial [Dentipellis fragilis]
MATRTHRDSKSTRRQPYSAAMSTRKSKTTGASSSSNLSSSRNQPNTSSSALPSAGADFLARETLRETSMRFARERYPHITPRDDLDLAMLTDGDFDTNGTIEEFHKFVADEIYDDGLNEGNKTEYMAKLRAELKEEMDGPSYVAGVKPLPGQDDVRIRPIPNSLFSLRLWPTGHPSLYAWAIDFVRTNTGEAVVVCAAQLQALDRGKYRLTLASVFGHDDASNLAYTGHRFGEHHTLYGHVSCSFGGVVLAFTTGSSKYTLLGVLQQHKSCLVLDIMTRNTTSREPLQCLNRRGSSNFRIKASAISPGTSSSAQSLLHPLGPSSFSTEDPGYP